MIVADQAAIDYCLTALEDAGLFPKVNYRSSSGTNKDVALISIEFNQKQHLNAGGNMTKVFFIGFTLFLLTPALPMTYGFESDMTATIHFADGEEVVCRKKQRASAITILCTLLILRCRVRAPRWWGRIIRRSRQI